MLWDDLSEPYANLGWVGEGGRGDQEVQTGQIPDRIDRADS